MKQRITKQFLDSVEANPHRDQFFSDTHQSGFGVKVTKGGKINFIVNARIRGSHPKRITIGQYPDWSPTEAKDKALSVLKALRRGIDPIREDRKKKTQEIQQAAHEKALTVPLVRVARNYLEARDLKTKTKYDYWNTFKNCFEDWADKPIRSITRQDIEKRYAEIQKNNRRNEQQTGIAQANKAMQFLSAIMNYAGAEEINGERLIKDNPVNVLKEKRIRKSLKPRETYVDLDDLWKVYLAVQSLENKTVGHLLELLISTGLRLNEATSLQWKNVYFDHKYFIVEDTKNRSDHVVPMPRGIEWILKSQRKMVPSDNPWVFPSSTADTHIVEIRRQVSKVCVASTVDFTPHDLRRTFATIAHCCGLNHTTIKRVMNHKHKDITEQYIQTKLEELRLPMEEIDNFITNTIVETQRDWELENLGCYRSCAEDDRIE